MDCTHGNTIKLVLDYPATHLTFKTITPKRTPVKVSLSPLFSLRIHKL